MQPIDNTQVRPPIAWVQRAACRGLDPAAWYPERGGSTAEARAVCAVCPVVVECLTHALRSGEKHGVWGGAGERVRRRLKVPWLARGHENREGCGCSWCGTVDEHRTWLEGAAPDGPQWLNGPGVRHARVATYARGCRCGACTFARSSLGGRLLREVLAPAGDDVPGWWWRWMRGRRDRALLPRARVLAELDLAERVELSEAS